MSMNLADYQEAASRTHNAGMGMVDAQACYALGLAGEAGEAADYVKKVLFHGHPLDGEKLKKELGDVLWYVTMTGMMFGLTLESIALANVAKLQARYPQGFTTQESQNRAAGDV